jgi:hypothetical protein
MKRSVILILTISAILCLYEARERLMLAHRENGAILAVAKNSASEMPNGQLLNQQLEQAIKYHSKIQKRSIQTSIVLCASAFIQFSAIIALVIDIKRTNKTEPNQ